MTQEVQVTITMEVEASKDKAFIKAFIEDMEQTYTRTVSRRNRMEVTKFEVTSIKEESEIYSTEPTTDKAAQQDATEEIATEREAYREGQIAWAYFDAGNTPHGNPYPKGSVQHTAWNRGFNVGA